MGQNQSTTSPATPVEEDETLLTAGLHFYNDTQKAMFLAWKVKGRLGLMSKIIEIDNAENANKMYHHLLITAKCASPRAAKIQVLAILTTMKDELIERLILADVLSHYRNPAQRQAALGVATVAVTSKQDGPKAPDIYANILATQAGRSLSYDDLTAVLDACDRYKLGLHNNGTKNPPSRPVQSQLIGQWVRRVDSIVSTGKPQGYDFPDSEQIQNSVRRYLQAWPKVTQLVDWIARIRGYLRVWRTNNPNASTTAPLPWTLSDIGWAIRQGHRHYLHKSHHPSSIWIMNLVNAICKVLYPQSGLEIRFLALYRVPVEELSKMAEHVFSRLAGSYAPHYGFNFMAAGITANSADKVAATVYSNLQRDHKAAYGTRLQAATDSVAHRSNFLDLSTRVKQLKVDKANHEQAKTQADGLVDVALRDMDDEYEGLQRATMQFLDQNRTGRTTELIADQEWLEEASTEMEQLDELMGKITVLP